MSAQGNHMMPKILKKSLTAKQYASAMVAPTGIFFIVPPPNAGRSIAAFGR
jgi:hypothetical protein